MERALNHELLGRALGVRESLPSPNELASIIGRAELAVLAGGGEVTRSILDLGWYLHGVAAVRDAPDLYGVERQRAAARVAAHILDLSLRATIVEDADDESVLEPSEAEEDSDSDRLRRCVAAQVSYLRSDLVPNALALFRRERRGEWFDTGLFDTGDRPALLVAAALFGGDVKWVLDYADRIRDEAGRYAEAWELETLEGTPHGIALDVVLAARELAIHLMYGRDDVQERCRARLIRLLERRDALFFPDARWVSALMLDVMGGLDAASVRAVLPPDVPEGVKKAFTVAYPPIVTLWPPQVDLLGSGKGVSALDSSVRRLIVSAPTSAGKTLSAQLLIATYLATEGKGVCYVAPTRSLCREVRASLLQRLRYIATDVAADLPEWFLPEGLTPSAAVEVMTPERLAFLLRSEGRGVLDRFGMFVFDEVHNINDAGRGWTLEGDLTFIHEATLSTEHRIVLLSAAVSNRAHFRAWLNTGGTEPVDFYRDWRGPRRLHALWKTTPEWGQKERLEKKRSNSPERERIPMAGQLLARDPGTGKTLGLRMGQVGDLVLRVPRGGGKRTKEQGLSTANYRMLVPLVKHLAGMGPVLVIEATRDGAARFASALAEDPNDDWAGDQILVDAASTLLGDDHDLTRAVRRGVGYHHGSLPVEIRTQIEEAVTAGALPVLVSTTTLTEGINLPVRSVVVSERGTYGSNEYDEFISGAKLLNAVGRAGRAAKETEGVIVIALRGQEEVSFDLFEPDDEALHVTSPLATESALEGLAALEEEARSSVDAVYEAEGAPSDFVSFVWFVASELERQGEEVTPERAMETLHRSLGWVQLDEAGRGVWDRASEEVVKAYLAAPPERRRRWAKAGMSVGSSRTLERLASEVVLAIPPDSRSLPAETLIRAILGDGRLERLLQLPEAPAARYLARVAPEDGTGASVLLDVLSDWVRGRPLREIADSRLAHVGERRRLERLVDLTSRYFELYLPWALSTIVEQANTLIEAGSATSGDGPVKLPDTVAPVVRWGVDRDTALRLILSGLTSRRMAMSIAEAWDQKPLTFGQSVFDWLGKQRVTDWVEMFEATPAELRNLLQVVRPGAGGAAARFLNGAAFTIGFTSDVGELAETPATLAIELDDEEIESVVVRAGELRVGALSSRHHGDVAGFIRGGVPLEAVVSSSEGQARVVLRLVEP